MPHIPDHQTHDPELVAAYAAGDATGPDLATATELVASCTACADLHRDLRAIASALPELPPAVRPRDFRITPEQAASLQPSGWRGVLAAFASPRFKLAAPLGTGLAAAGLAGLLLASPGGLQPAASGGAVDGTGAAAQVPVEALPDDTSAGASAAASGPLVLAPAASAAASGPAAIAPAASAAASQVLGALAPEGGPPSPEAASNIRGSAAEGGTPASGDAGRIEIKSSDDAFAAAPDAAPLAPPPDNTPLVVVAAGLVVVGVLLVALRFGARLIA
jgi:hypothetical protein